MEDCRRTVVVVDKATRFVNVCSLHATYRKNFPKLQHRFDSLKETLDEDLAVERETARFGRARV